MGTNFYLRKKKPRLVYDEIHIAKTSWGWKPLFEQHIGEIESVRQLKNAYDSGEYIIVDEEGDEYNWEEFDERVLQWAECQRQVIKERGQDDFEPIDHVEYDNRNQDKYGFLYDRSMHYHDEEGYDFFSGEFC
jgi:hypothetical protein